MLKILQQQRENGAEIEFSDKEIEEALQNITIALRDSEVIDDEGNMQINQESLLAIKENS